MSAYTDWPGAMVPVAGTDFYTATDPLPWDIGFKGSNLLVVVPATFRHDVSIPRWLTWAFSRHDPRYQRFARLHDWLLSRAWSRVEAAATAHQALVADGVPAWQRLAMLMVVILYRYA